MKIFVTVRMDHFHFGKNGYANKSELSKSVFSLQEIFNKRSCLQDICELAQTFYQVRAAPGH